MKIDRVMHTCRWCKRTGVQSFEYLGNGEYRCLVRTTCNNRVLGLLGINPRKHAYGRRA